MRRPRRGPGRDAWWIALAAVPVHVALACGTDLSPDETYYLAAARTGATLPDHPPLTVWLIRAADALSALPAPLRVRLPAIATSLALTLLVASLARAAGRSRASATWGALLATWLPLPAAGGFVTTPDGPATVALACALVAAPRPSFAAAAAAGVALGAGSLAKVAVWPSAVALAAIRARRREPLAAAALIAPCLALAPWTSPSLRFQLAHAFGGAAPEPAARLTAVVATLAAAWALANPVVVAVAARARTSWTAELAVVLLANGAAVLASAAVRGVPAEPNWWVPAMLALLVVGAAALASASAAARRWAAWTTVAPTVIAAAHAAHPFLPVPARADPTARLHVDARGRHPLDAAGTGPYTAAADACVADRACRDFLRRVDRIDANIARDASPGHRR